MTSLYKFEESEEFDKNNISAVAGADCTESCVVGGASIQFDKDAVDMPVKRFENLVIPFGLQFTNINMIGGGTAYDELSYSDGFMDESMFSKLFYSVAKDLESNGGKSKKSITKKNRR